MKSLFFFLAGIVVGFVIAVSPLREGNVGQAAHSDAPAVAGVSAIAGLYRDSAGDSLEFRPDGRVVVNEAEICQYSVDGSEISKDCQQHGTELLKIDRQGNVVSTMSVGGDKVIYKKAS